MCSAEERHQPNAHLSNLVNRNECPVAEYMSAKKILYCMTDMTQCLISFLNFADQPWWIQMHQSQRLALLYLSTAVVTTITTNENYKRRKVLFIFINRTCRLWSFILLSYFQRNHTNLVYKRSWTVCVFLEESKQQWLSYVFYSFLLHRAWFDASGA